MANKTDYKVATVNNLGQSQLIIPAGATQSPVFDCGGTSPGGLLLPAAFTSCNISFSVGKYGPNGAFYTLTNFDGSAFAIAAAASEWIPLLPSMFCGVNFLQLNFSAAQTGGYTMELALIPIFQGIHA